MAETVKPRLAPPLETLKPLFVYHPMTGEIILQFGCRISFSGTMAISWSLVHQAAIVIAQIKGYLSKSKDRDMGLVEDSESDLIVAGKYYFHATEPTFADYEICCDFDLWEPPASPDDLPEPWKTLTNEFNERSFHIQVPKCSASKIANWVKFTDPRCMLTGSRDVIEGHHLVPEAHSAWVSLSESVRLDLILLYLLGFPLPNLGSCLTL